MNDNTKTFKTWLQQNIIWVFGVVITLANLYIASLLQPIKSDFVVLADRVSNIEEVGSPTAQKTLEKVEAIKEQVKSIGDSQIRFEQKLDRHIESFNSSNRQ